MGIESDWPAEVFGTLKAAQIAQACYVPDAGHARLIQLLHADPQIQTTVLSTEEEGVALCAGAWLGGQRSVLLMQSSGVGNCVNMFSILANCRIPFVTLVTMRGEWGEFNPWQIPMGRATPQALEVMGLKVIRVETPQELVEAVSCAMVLAFDSDQAVAILISQRMLGAKHWVTK